MRGFTVFPRAWASLVVLSALASHAWAAQAFVELDEKRLQRSLDTYYGAPYLYGGTSRGGIDCSGLVVAVYRDQGVELPRTTHEQFRVGESVPRDRLALGDLVFFNTTGRGASHVGIVNGPGTFLHASTADGVVRASLSDPYWTSRYLGARRVASPSTYLVSGERVGAAASDRVAIADRYPFIDYELIDIPTNRVGEARSASLQFRTNVAGDVVLHPQVSLWERVQVAGYLRVGNVLGGGAPSLSWPDGLVKMRINDQTGHVPGFAVGLDSRQLRIVKDTIYGDSLTTTRRRGLFLVGSGTLLYHHGFWIGRTRSHAGASLHTIRDVSLRDDVSFFAGIDQQLMRRVTLMGELDNVLGRGGWHANLGARISITDAAVVEYSLTFLGKRDTKLDKVLKFSFNVQY